MSINVKVERGSEGAETRFPTCLLYSLLDDV